MQIGSSNPLSFLPGSSTPLAGQANDNDTDATTGTQGSGRGVAVPPAPPAQDAAGVILTLAPAATPGAALPADLVYSASPKAKAAQDADSDTARMALQHSQAVARSAGSSSSLSVDKDGVLVAKPASAGEIKAQEFVHFAVTAMRDYADTQDRLKQAARQAEAAAPAPLIPRSLGDVQKLAARFKLFA